MRDTACARGALIAVAVRPEGAFKRMRDPVCRCMCVSEREREGERERERERERARSLVIPRKSRFRVQGSTQ